MKREWENLPEFAAVIAAIWFVVGLCAFIPIASSTEGPAHGGIRGAGVIALCVWLGPFAIALVSFLCLLAVITVGCHHRGRLHTPARRQASAGGCALRTRARRGLKLGHFYHCWCDGDWTEPVVEHVDALLAADFQGPVYLGLVGASMWRGAARDAFDPLDVRVAVEADSGFEQVTLAKVREYALEHEGAVLYAHSKGSADASEFRKQWRRSMTKLVVSNWRTNLRRLDPTTPRVPPHDPPDAIGCHWLTRERFPGFEVEFPEGTPFFGGNFWMARCDYLRRLPEPSTRSRFDAERWIGLGDPRVLDLNPGWPAASLFV